jgi:glyoxylate reductase
MNDQNKPKVFVARAIPEEGIKMLEEVCEVEVWAEELPPSREVIMKKVEGVDGFLPLLTDKVDGEIMDAAGTQLKVISNYAVGYDNINVADATERGILVCNTPGVLTGTTSDLAFTLLVSAARRIVEAVDYVKAGKWKTWGPQLLLGPDIHEATLGIVGMGKIGAAMAERAKGFSMNVVYYDQFVSAEDGEKLGAKQLDSLDDLLQQSDFVSIHVPLTDDTRGMFDEGVFKKMKSSAILVNTARGPVVDPDALYDALKNGDIAYAALDVTDPEPMPADHKLLTLPNCLVVPHIGSASIKARRLMSTIAADNLLTALRGDRPKHVVNPEVIIS